ncbi:hypothetical protein [Flavobacterium sp. LB1P62]|uniref:hypothetical protein n=1 Tax=Flavobacterium sp. LB1P62 TaxID=3401715 RepID=UPI003AAA62AF
MFEVVNVNCEIHIPQLLMADDFIYANIIAEAGTQTISGTLCFWTHNHSIVGNNDDDIDYSTYTKAGGAGVSSGTGNEETSTKYIDSGFFVQERLTVM